MILFPRSSGALSLSSGSLACDPCGGASHAEQRFSRLLFHIGAAGCVLGVLGTLYFLGGLAGHVQNPFLTIPVAFATPAALVFFFYVFSSALGETSGPGKAIWFLILIVCITELMLSLVPPVARDELTHHLAIPRLYARRGRIIEVPIAPYSYYPMLLDMLFTPWVYFELDFVPKVLHGIYGLLTGLAIYAYLSRRMNTTYGLLGCFLFISIPAVLRVSHWAYVDLGVTFYSTVSLLCLLRWRENKLQKSWLTIAALSAGFALATKPNGLLSLLLLSALVAFSAASDAKERLGRGVSETVLFAGIALLPFIPWAFKNYLQTGNPFFPHFGQFFSSRSTPAFPSESVYVNLGVFAKRELLYGESWWQIVALPVRLFFAGKDDDPQYFDGALSPLLILLLPWAFKGKWLEEKKLLVGFATLFLAYAICLVDLRVRYVLPIVPPLTILAVYGVFNLYLRIKRLGYLIAGLLFFSTLHLTYLYHYVHQVAPMDYLSGRETRHEYLSRMIPEYPALQYINRETASSAKIYLLFVGRRAYHCERDYYHDGGELPGLLIAAVRHAREPADIGRRLRERQLTHLLIREDLLARFLHDNLTPAEKSLWNDFVSNYVKAVFRDRGYSVVQMHG